MTIPSHFLRGSLITLKRKCGSPGCRCAGENGIPHESPAFSCTISGKSHIITLQPDEVLLVSDALARYALEKNRLEHACEKGVAWIRAKVDARRDARKAR